MWHHEMDGKISHVANFCTRTKSTIIENVIIQEKRSKFFVRYDYKCSKNENKCGWILWKIEILYFGITMKPDFWGVTLSSEYTWIARKKNLIIQNNLVKIRHLRVVRDTAERGVKLMEVFQTAFTTRKKRKPKAICFVCFYLGEYKDKLKN